MQKPTFNEALEDIVAKDGRYDEQAYHFIRDALDYTIKDLEKPQDGPGRHVSGGELCDGIREFALSEYGPLARTVLERWGVTETGHFGDLVFNMVDYGILGKTEDDRREDFEGLFDFDSAFSSPFRPRKNLPIQPSSGSMDRN